jgi:hypothetical protein
MGLGIGTKRLVPQIESRDFDLTQNNGDLMRCIPDL